VKNKNIKNKSRYLSLLLRHSPEKANLKLDEYGWCFVKDLLKAIDMSKEDLDYIVLENDKQRFRYDKNQLRIKASQGHSLKVKDDFKRMTPPEILYHGTSKSSQKQILKSGGLKKMRRNHVHLSSDISVATQVGMRYAKYQNNLVIFRIPALQMHNMGYEFYLSENNVWLTEAVPKQFLQ